MKNPELFHPMRKHLVDKTMLLAQWLLNPTLDPSLRQNRVLGSKPSHGHNRGGVRNILRVQVGNPGLEVAKDHRKTGFKSIPGEN